MRTGDIFDKLNEARNRIWDLIDERELKITLIDGRFALTEIGKNATGCIFYATLLVETNYGLRVPLDYRFYDGDNGTSFDIEQLVDDTARVITALSADPGHARAHVDLVDAIAECFAVARKDAIPLSVVRLVARPLPIGVDDVCVQYELTSKMLGRQYDCGTFTMQIEDAKDFRTCFAQEILPEQRARAARALGLSVPEAVND